MITRIACIAGLAAIAACAERASTAASGDLFRAALPGEWQEVSARSDLVVYRSGDGQSRVTFSTLLAKEPMSEAKQHETLQTLTEHHRTAQLAVSDQVTLTPVESSEAQVTARFQGNDPDNRRRTATLLLGAPRGVVIVHLEAIGVEQPAFAAQAEKLFAGVETVK
ncbi:MAG TPA: hypothetical protein VE046_03690 [Steroidobacteraceae bacterium]|nr:hypothetical protein [Steroidobacteraceae bacterium]